MTNETNLTSNKSAEFSLQHWQERFVLGILRAASLFGLVSIVAVVFLDPTTSALLKITYVAFYIVLLIFTLAPVPYLWRAGFLLVMAYLLGVIELTSGGLVGAARLYLFATVLLANLLLSYRASIYVLAFSTLTYAAAGFAMLNGYFQPSLKIAIVGEGFDWITSSATYIFLATTVNLALRMLQNEFQTAYKRGQDMLIELGANQHTLEARVSERTVSLEKRTAELSAANAVAQSISSAKEIEVLLPVVVHAITEEYGYYHAGIYLLDEKSEYAFLQAASSDGGKRMLARQQQIVMGDEGLLQKCFSKRTHQIAQEIEAETAKLDNPDLPSTRARGAFPLVARERFIGILDVHSTNPNAFQQTEVETIEIVADQLSLALENARLFTDMQAIIEQMQQAGDARTHGAWSEMTKRALPVYQYTPLVVQKIGAVSVQREDAGTLSIPILLRGRSIGKIHLKRKSGAGAWADQEQSMVGDVAEQIALALDNARLLEDAQTRASRERSLSEIAARIGAAVDVETILRTTVQEIGKVLGDSEVTVQLNSESTDA